MISASLNVKNSNLFKHTAIHMICDTGHKIHDLTHQISYLLLIQSVKKDKAYSSITNIVKLTYIFGLIEHFANSVKKLN